MNLLLCVALFSTLFVLTTAQYVNQPEPSAQPGFRSPSFNPRYSPYAGSFNYNTPLFQQGYRPLFFNPQSRPYYQSSVNNKLRQPQPGYASLQVPSQNKVQRYPYSQIPLYGDSTGTLHQGSYQNGKTTQSQPSYASIQESSQDTNNDFLQAAITGLPKSSITPTITVDEDGPDRFEATINYTYD